MRDLEDMLFLERLWAVVWQDMASYPKDMPVVLLRREESDRGRLLRRLFLACLSRTKDLGNSMNFFPYGVKLIVFCATDILRTTLVFH